MVSGDGTVAVTQVFRQPRGLLVDSFDSKEDLINALHTSCFIPGYRFAVSKPKSAILFFALMFSLLWFGKDICHYLNSIWSTLEKTWENEEISAVMETTVQCLVLNVSMFCVQVLGTKASDYFPRSCLHWWWPDTFYAPYSCWQNSMYSQTFSPRVPIWCMCIRSQFWGWNVSALIMNSLIANFNSQVPKVMNMRQEIVHFHWFVKLQQTPYNMQEVMYLK
jgi:hypothetical protein